MAAGLGFKTFNTGDVLSAADVNGYLMQGVLVFANAAARDSAITSPQEGQFAYLKDTNVTTYYTGSAWANLDTTGMTNPMTTTGDTIYSSSGSTPARLGIGTTGQVMTVSAGGVPTWASPASSGGITLISETSVSNSASTNVNDVFSSTYKNYRIMIVSTGSNSGSLTLRLRLSGSDTSSGYDTQEVYSSSTSVTGRSNVFGTDEWYIGDFGSADGLISFDLSSPNLADDTNFVSQSFFTGMLRITGGSQSSATQFTGFTAFYSANFTGSIFIYGYAKA